MAIGRIPEPGTGIPESIVDAKGDLIAASAADVPARLAVGTNEHRLVADSGQTVGLKYVADTTNYAIAAKGDLLVGTAADTLQALSVGTDGHTLVADSAQTTGLKWAAPSSGAMTFITKNTFSNVANVELQNIFSSSYDNYQVYLEIKAATNTDDIQFQMMYSTNTVISTSYYGSALSAYTSTSVLSSVDATKFTIMSTSANDGGFVMLNFQNVGNASEFAQWHGTGVSNNEVALLIGGYVTQNQTYTGIKLFSASSNITGIATVYGLAKS